MGSVASVDEKVSHVVHQASSMVLDVALIVPGVLFGQRYVVVPMQFLAFFCGWNVMFLYLCCVLCTVLCTTILKKAFGRPRPLKSNLGTSIFNLRDALHNNAFPSGDSAQASTFYSLVALLVPDLAFYGLVVGLPLTMLARVHFGAHWFGDTIAGAVIGWILVNVLFVLVDIHYVFGIDPLGSFIHAPYASSDTTVIMLWILCGSACTFIYKTIVNRLKVGDHHKAKPNKNKKQKQKNSH